MKAITARNLDKKYILRQERRLLINEIMDLLTRSGKGVSEFFALRDISFEVEQGETFGIIGENGSGKSTLLKIIAGVTKQSAGELEINGSVSALLELGAGFHPYLTGRENIFLNGSIMGLKKREITKIFDDIVTFAEIEDFIDVAVKNYSSGMFVRLGFAIAINLDPDILLIDEVLSVGDEAFQRKCFQKINEFKNRGKTIIFVTHDMNAVSSLCDRVMLLKKGRILKMGRVGGVVQFYLRSVGEKKGVVILSKGELTLIFNNGKLNIFFKEKELTHNYGGYSAIFAGEMWHETVKATWEIQQTSEDQLKCSGRFRSLPLNQIWEIEILDEDSIRITISLEILKRCILDEFHTSFLLSDDYKQWFSEIETGEFPEITAQDREWIHLNRHNHPSEFCGVRSIENDTSSLPPVVVDYSHNKKDFIATLLNSDCTLKSRVIQWLRIFPKKERIFEPGSYEKFMTCKIDILNEEELTKKYLDRIKLRDKIQSDNLIVKCDIGSLSILFENRRLTADGGIYMSLKSKDFWHDSTQSICEKEKIDEDRISIKGKFRRLPISFLWELEALQGNKIDLDVKLRIHGEVELAALAIFLTFDPRYRKFMADNRELQFKEEDESPDEIEKPIVKDPSKIAICPEESSPREVPDLFIRFQTGEDGYSVTPFGMDAKTDGRIIKLIKNLSPPLEGSGAGIVEIGKLTVELQT